MSTVLSSRIYQTVASDNVRSPAAAERDGKITDMKTLFRFPPVYMFVMALLVAGAAQVHAQTPAAGAVTQTTVTTATALAPAGATTATQIQCQFSNPQKPTVHVVCTQNSVTVMTGDWTPAVGATNGAIGSINLSGNAVTWIIQQLTAGSVTWQIAANGTSQSGTF